MGLVVPRRAAKMRLSAIAYYADFLICGLAILALAFTGLFTSIVAGRIDDLAIWLTALPAGLVTWSFAEYWVHRYLYHEVPTFRDLHDRHHGEPEAFIGGPPVLMIAAIFALTWLPLIFVSVPAAQAFTCGALIGYMAYMLVHHAVHHWSPAQGTPLYALRRHHALHHHHSEDGNFGIITSFWDRVFGTLVLPVGTARKRHHQT